jgi:hypothetical protein
MRQQVLRSERQSATGAWTGHGFLSQPGNNTRIFLVGFSDARAVTRPPGYEAGLRLRYLRLQYQYAQHTVFCGVLSA